MIDWRIAFTVCLFSFSTACSSLPSQDDEISALQNENLRSPASSYVHPAYADTIRWINESLSFRAKALQFAKEKNIDKSSIIRITYNEGVYIRKMMDDYLETRRHLSAIPIIHSKNFSIQSKVEISSNRPTKIVSQDIYVGDLKTTIYRSVRINPLDQEGQKFIFTAQLAIASATMLMDNYLVAIKPFHENTSLRYALNYDSGKRRALQEMANEFNSSSNRRELKRAIEFIEDIMRWRRRVDISPSAEETALYEMAQSSIWYLAVRKSLEPKNIFDEIFNRFDEAVLFADHGGKAITNGLSMGFGNLVGMVATRKGYLTKLTREQRIDMAKELEPLDILMEKTPFRLTDKLIPGHYGHVAIWVGTEEQLIKLGVWSQIPKHIQNKISNGHNIVEALRPGVQINTLEHFLNIDDMLVIRENRPHISDAYKRQALLTTIAQIGKEYDFNFDVNSHDKIVCSELAYVVFGDIEWPLNKSLGRYTISPDHVAKIATGPRRIFEPVMLYFEGQRYYKELPYSVELLLRATPEAYAEFRKIQKN